MNTFSECVKALLWALLWALSGAFFYRPSRAVKLPKKRPSRAEKRRLKRALYMERKNAEKTERSGQISVYTYYKSEPGCSGGCGSTRTAYVLYGQHFGGEKHGVWILNAVVKPNQDLMYDYVTEYSCCGSTDSMYDFRTVDPNTPSVNPSNTFPITYRYTYSELLMMLWTPRVWRSR